MNLAPSADAQAIAETVLKMIATLPGNPDGTDDDLLHRQAGELGLPALLVPEEAGGLGLDLLDAVPVLEVLGRRPTRQPWVGDLVAVPRALLAADAEEGHRLLTEVAGGERRLGFARTPPDTGLPLALRLDLADQVVSATPSRVSLWPVSQWETLGIADLTGSQDRWTTRDEAAQQWPLRHEEVTTRVLSAARVAAASFVLGSGRAALDLAVEHAATRQQFGRPIGSFQAVKHLLAGALESLSMAEPLVPAAARGIDTLRSTAPLEAATALRQCAGAATSAIRSAIQVHGALGYTDEVVLGQLLAQVRIASEFWGPVGALEDEIADALAAGIDGPALTGATR